MADQEAQPVDPAVAMMEMMTAMREELRAVGQRMTRLEQPVRPQPIRNLGGLGAWLGGGHQAQGVHIREPARGEHHEEPPDLPERYQRRRAHPRGFMEDEFEEPPPPPVVRQTNHDMKLNAPNFAGKVDPEAYLEC